MARKKSSKPSSTTKKGVGDYVEEITKATGIKALVDWFSKETGIDCGCEERKQKLNEMFRSKKVTECPTIDELEFIESIRDKVHIRNYENLKLTEIHNRVFGLNGKVTGCASCVKEKIKQLTAVYNAYVNA